MSSINVYTAVVAIALAIGVWLNAKSARAVGTGITPLPAEVVVR